MSDLEAKLGLEDWQTPERLNVACPPGGAWGPRSTRECPCPHGLSLDPCIRVGRVKKEGSPQGLLFGPLPPPLPTKPSKWKKCGLYFTSVFQFPLNCVCSPRGLTAWTHRTPFHWSRCSTWAAVPLVGAEDSGVFSPPMPGSPPFPCGEPGSGQSQARF